MLLNLIAGHVAWEVETRLSVASGVVLVFGPVHVPGHRHQVLADVAGHGGVGAPTTMSSLYRWQWHLQ